MPICDLVVILSNGQVVFLDHIVSTYPHFLEVLTPLDLSKLTSLMLDSLPRESCPPPLVGAKIRAIRACIKSPVFNSGVAEARALILPTFCSHLKVRQSFILSKSLSKTIEVSEFFIHSVRFKSYLRYRLLVFVA